MTRPRIALTGTVTDCEVWLADWLAHHLHVVDQIIVWIDDPAEMAFAESFASDRVTVLAGQQIAHASRLTQTLTRQNANTDAAIQMAAMTGNDWLVHLDADELFVPLSEDVWNTDAGQLVFPNHEAVPIWDAPRPLADMTRFRVNGRHRFLLYDNGKAALRLGSPPVGARAHGPHRFSGAEPVASAAAAILHYAVPGFALWWRKYARLGAFSDFWCEQPDAPIPASFHTHSRDLIRAAQRTGDKSECMAFYRQQMDATGETDLATVARDAAGQVRIL